MEKQKYLRIPFDKYDEASLEALPDEIFFSRRFVVSAEEQEIIDKNTYRVNGRILYKAKVVEPIFRKYAAITNPEPGAPGSRLNPLIRFGKAYVYNDVGRLSQLRHFDRDKEWFTLTPDMQLAPEQVEMIHLLKGRPISSDTDCPHVSPEKLEHYKAYGLKRKEKRRTFV